MSNFFDVDLKGSTFTRVDLRDAQFRSVDFSGVVMRNVDLAGASISGDIDDLTINGVDVSDLVQAALDARYPLRSKMRPTDPEGFREAWRILERLWRETGQRAQHLPPALLHESVDDEGTFKETLRHLVFATDSWIRRAIHGEPSPWDPLGLPWDEMPETPGIPRDRSARPSLDEVLALRADRIATVTAVIGGLAPEPLAGDTTAVDGPGWPPPRSFPVKECLLVVLNEEWEHRRYAERDLAILENRT